MAFRRSMIQMASSQIASLVIGTIGLVVLARFISPDAFGVFALVVTLFLTSETLVNFGLAEMMVRERTLHRAKLASATGLSVSLSLLLSSVIMAVALFRPGLLGPYSIVIAALFALTLVVRSVQLPVETALRREMRFGALSLIGVARTAIDVTVAISFALAGFGTAALVAGFMLSRIMSVLILFAVAPQGSRVAPSFTGFGGHLRDGSRIATISMLPKLGDTALVSAVGGLLSVATLGIYNRAERVGQLFDDLVFTGIRPTILPAMANAVHRGVAAAQIYLVKVTHLSALCWPAFALLAVVADPLVAVILGDQWDAAVVPLQIIAAGGLAAPFTKMSMKFFVALGLTGPYLRIQTIHQLSRVVFGVAAAWISLEAVLVVLSASLVLKAALIHAHLRPLIDIDERELVTILGRAALVSALTVAAPLALLYTAPDVPSLTLLVTSLALGGAGWLAGLVIVNHPLIGEMAVMGRPMVRAVIHGAPSIGSIVARRHDRP